MREVLGTHRSELSRKEMEERMVDVLRRMRITDPQRVLSSYPHQLSGGLCQRVAIALAIITGPKIVLADECTTALDVTTQAEVVALFRELVRESGVALVFVTHNILLAAELCDRVVVMYAGQAVESGPPERVLKRPHHPYTAGLLASVPGWEDDRAFQGIAGSAPRISPDTVGCRFAARCFQAEDACVAADVRWAIASDGGGYRCIKPLALPEGDAPKRVPVT
jgi:oligopeptide/dipeptide ABC transporter ATP-binding protein